MDNPELRGFPASMTLLTKLGASESYLVEYISDRAIGAPYKTQTKALL